MFQAIRIAKAEAPKPVPPQQKVADAAARVGRLEAALQLLGEDDPDAEPLKVALKQARMPPIRVACAEAAHSSSVRRRRRSADEEAARATPALSLVQMGELSAARQALEGASLAPGNLATLGMLTDPTRRPPVPRSVLSQEVRDTEPAEPVALDPLEFLTCLRKARRGAAAGPSGMTSDHLFPMPENEGDSQRLVEVASALAMARVPEEISEAIRLGRLTALSKPDGGARGIVVGDILRRMVAGHGEADLEEG